MIQLTPVIAFLITCILLLRWVIFSIESGEAKVYSAIVAIGACFQGLWVVYALRGTCADAVLLQRAVGHTVLYAVPLCGVAVYDYARWLFRR